MPKAIHAARNCCTLRADVEVNLHGARNWKSGQPTVGEIAYTRLAGSSADEFDDDEVVFDRMVWCLAEHKGGGAATEHGITQSKRAVPDVLQSPVQRALMLRRRRAIDRENTMSLGEAI